MQSPKIVNNTLSDNPPYKEKQMLDVPRINELRYKAQHILDAPLPNKTQSICDEFPLFFKEILNNLQNLPEEELLVFYQNTDFLKQELRWELDYRWKGFYHRLYF